MQTLHTIVLVCNAAVAHDHWAGLDSVWILNIYIDIAVLAAFGYWDIWLTRRSICVEDCDTSVAFIGFR